MTNRDLNDLCHPHMNSNQVNVAFHYLGLLTLEIYGTPFKLPVLPAILECKSPSSHYSDFLNFQVLGKMSVSQ